MRLRGLGGAAFSRALPNEGASLVHVDVDLYEPTLASRRFCWPLLARNGMLVCDDCGSPRCPGAKQAFDEFFAELGMGFMELPTMQAIAIKMDASPERPT